MEIPYTPVVEKRYVVKVSKNSNNQFIFVHNLGSSQSRVTYLELNFLISFLTVLIWRSFYKVDIYQGTFEIVFRVLN